MRILVIGNASWSLVNFRGDMLRAMQQRGHVVGVCTGEPNDRALKDLKQWGVPFYLADLDRRAINLISDIWYMRKLKAAIRDFRPDLVFSYTAKPVVYGSLVAAFAGVPQIAAMITGAGAAVNVVGGFRAELISKIVQTLYRIAFLANERVLLQNEDDRDLFVRHRLVPHAKTSRIYGSGINLERFPISPPVINPVRFLLIARLLPDKGVREFAAACKQLKDAGLSFEAHLIGPLEQGGATIAEAEVRGWEAQGILKWGGEVADVRPEIAKTSVYVLPSYREGVPRSTLEAMSMGRPVITTDSVGCRETVRDGVNGFIVPVRDATKLAEAMRKFIDRPELIPTMGAASRQYVEECFDVNKVNATIIRELGL